MKTWLVLGTLLVNLLLGAVAHASLINAPLPTNTYITHNGYEWAWAFPLPANAGWGAPYDFDIAYQSQFGWRVPTAAELQLAPLATDFIFPGANVPLGGTDPVSGAVFSGADSSLTGAAANAVPYFSDYFFWADWSNGLGTGPGQLWAGTPGASSYAEQLVIRDDSSAPVPEPSTILLLGAGLIGLGAYGRRKKKA